MSNIVNCPVCNSPHHSERTYEKNRYLQCLNCNLIWRNPPVDLSFTTSYYKTSNPTKEINTSKQQLYLNILSKAENMLGRKGSLLDVGCGDGDFLYLAKENGWEVMGVEPVEELVNYAKERGLDVVKGVLKDIDESEKYDLVTYWDVFMMIQHPSEEQKDIQKRMNDDGLVYKRIRQHQIVRLMEDSWRMFFRYLKVANPAVYHPYNYEPKTIEALWNNDHYVCTIENGMLTAGDPYGISNKQKLAYLFKKAIQVFIGSIEKIPVKGPYLSPTMDVWIRKTGEKDA